jgi:hypothetical protein
MPELQKKTMQNLYGQDVWEGFVPLANSTLSGWNGDHPSLRRLASLPGDKLVADVGVWKGQSTINMALAMRDAGIDGCVLAIDTYLGSPEHWDTIEFSRTNAMPNLFEIFMSNVIHAGVEDYVIPLPQTSVTASMVLKSKGIYPNLVHVDAAHEYEEALRDFQIYYDILSPGGYIIGDDYHETWPGVVRAAGEFSAAIQRPLEIDGVKWIMRKP